MASRSEVLDSSRKRTPVAEVFSASEKLHRAGIGARFSFIAGFPNEPPVSLADPYRTVKALSQIDGAFETPIYFYANTRMQTNDYFFAGFLAVWNIVVLYIYILLSPEWINLAVVALCCFLTFVPWKYVHPLRVVFLRPLTLIMTVIWSVTVVGLVFAAEKEQHPMTTEPLLFWLWVGASLYFVTISAWRSIDEARDED